MSVKFNVLIRFISQSRTLFVNEALPKQNSCDCQPLH